MTGEATIMMQILHPPFPASLFPLIEPIDIHLAARAVIEASAPGSVYADDPQQPASLLVRARHRFHLAGAPDNQHFNHSLRQLFAKDVIPNGLGEGFTMIYSPGWEDPVENEILADYYPLLWKREYYELKLPDEYPQPVDIPAGYQLLPVDSDLLSQAGLENLDELEEEMQSERDSVAAFLANSFGIAVRREQALVSWCLSEYNWNGRCEVGIATHPSYRRCGLATLAGHAFLAQAAAHQISQVGWHCLASNQPSGATALNLGFQKKVEYGSYLVIYHPPAQLAMHGNHNLHQGRYREALEWYERAFSLKNPPAWAFFEAGCAHSMLHEASAAFSCLRQAASQGLNDRSIYQKEHFLDELHAEPEWEKLMKDLHPSADR